MKQWCCYLQSYRFWGFKGTARSNTGLRSLTDEWKLREDVCCCFCWCVLLFERLKSFMRCKWITTAPVGSRDAWRWMDTAVWGGEREAWQLEPLKLWDTEWQRRMNKTSEESHKMMTIISRQTSGLMKKENRREEIIKTETSNAVRLSPWTFITAVWIRSKPEPVTTMFLPPLDTHKFKTWSKDRETQQFELWTAEHLNTFLTIIIHSSSSYESRYWHIHVFFDAACDQQTLI